MSLLKIKLKRSEENFTVKVECDYNTTSLSEIKRLAIEAAEKQASKPTYELTHLDVLHWPEKDRIAMETPSESIDIEQPTACEDCEGSGVIRYRPVPVGCPKCDGTGKEPER